MMPALTGTLLGAMIATIALPGVVLAQAGRDVNRPRGWADHYAPSVSYEGMTPAARAAAYANLAEIERVFWRIPEVANPKEFVVKKQYFGGSRPQLMTNGVASYSLRLWFFGRMGPDRKQVAGEGCTCIEIVINPGTGEQKTDGNGRGFMIEPEVGDPIPGASAVFGRMTPDGEGGVTVLFTRGGTFPFTTMNREEYLRAQIFELEGKDGAKLREASQAFEKTPYEQWMAEAPQRKKDRDELALSLRGIKTPEEIRQTIAEMEATERQVTAQLRAQDEATRKQIQTTMPGLSGPGDDLRAQIAAMSAEDRATPAMVARNWELLPVGAPNTARILTPILDFWRVRASPVEIHSILVSIGGSTGDEIAQPEVINAVWQAFQKTDWAALKRMVEAP